MVISYVDVIGLLMAKAYILIGGKIGCEKEIISQVKEIENVKEVHGTLGMYDILAKVEADNEEQVRQTILNKIRDIDKISSTISLMRLEGGEDFPVDSNKLMGSILGQNSAQAYVVLHTDQGQEFFVTHSLNKIPQVKEADVVTGHYDVIGKIEASDSKELEKIISKDIRKIPNVRTTMTLNVIQEQE